MVHRDAGSTPTGLAHDRRSDRSAPQEEGESTMRKPISIILVVAGVLLAGATAMLWQRNQQLAATVEDARKSGDATSAQYGDAIAAISAIQDSLGSLGVPEASAPLMPGTQASERGMSAARGREALDRIALVKAGITRTKEHIRQLESRLHANGIHVAGLQHLIENLKQTIAEREERLAVLTGQVDSLSTAVTGLTAVVVNTRDSIQTQSATIETQRADLGRVYYVIGSKHDLLDAGIVKASGGVLGMGKTLTTTGTTPSTLFKSIDTDVDQVLNIPSPKARVLSAQPTGSYTLTAVGNQMQLRITDAHEFRAIKRVVIMTAS
jgi:hypothetical protein